MLSADETTQTTGAIERLPRPMNHRDLLAERRQNILQQKQVDKQTDNLQGLNGDAASGKLTGRQIAVLREENKRLNANLQQLLAEYNRLQTQFDKDTAAIHHAHQQEIEQYQSHLREMMEEHKQIQESNRQLEQRYQQLYHSFQDAVEEEAHKMVAEAAHTLQLSPEHTPALLQDVVKTVELQVKQEEDESLAHTLYLLREAQRKNKQMEEEHAREREKIAAELRNLLTLQNSARQQAVLRAEMVEKRLKARWSLTFASTAVGLLLLLILLQLACLAILKWDPLVAVLAPMAVCVVLALIVTRLNSSMSKVLASAPRKVATSKKS